MSSMSKAWRLLAALLVGFVIGVTIKITWELTAKQPCKWNNPPIIINCTGKDLSEKTIIKAVKYWAKHGEEILFYEYSPVDFVCKNDSFVDGFIIIKTDVENTIKEGVLATTSRQSRLGTIKSAIILFKPGTHNYLLLLEHELGHAFGYSHKNRLGHIMNPYYDLMGPRFN